MILQNILKYRNGSNFAHTLLSTIKSSGANPPENKNFLIMLLYNFGDYCGCGFSLSFQVI